jgi:hypothetical protein
MFLIRLIFPLFLLCFSATASAQGPAKIKFAKDQGFIYFFLKGDKTDTIVKDRSDIFYLLVNDSLKNSFNLCVENGRLVKTSNDSLVKFEYLPGLKYETFYSKRSPGSAVDAGIDKKRPPASELNTMINGTTDRQKNTILIRITDRREEKVLIENLFYYK